MKTEENTFENLADQWRQMWMDNWSSVTRSTVDSETFKNANSAAFNWTLAGQKMMRESLGQSLEALDLPRRSDLARLSKQIAALESRVLDLQEELAATRAEVRSQPAAAPAPKAPAAEKPQAAARPKAQPPVKKTIPAKKAANQKGKSK